MQMIFGEDFLDPAPKASNAFEAGKEQGRRKHWAEPPTSSRPPRNGDRQQYTASEMRKH